MRGVRALSILVCLLLSLVSNAQTQRLEKAKDLFTQGKLAYEQGNYEKAYASFKECYLLSHEPALLYNISSALQGLRRPHEAAEALRSFLRLRPDDPEKGAMEERIRTLEEEQKLLDAERRNQTPPSTPTPAPATPIVAPASMTPGSDAALTATHQVQEERRKKKIWMGVGISLGILAAGGLALGLGLGLSGGSEPFTTSTFGPLPGTR